MFHMSNVTFHMSHVIYNGSHVTSSLSCFFVLFDKVMELVSEGSVINGAYID